MYRVMVPVHHCGAFSCYVRRGKVLKTIKAAIKQSLALPSSHVIDDKNRFVAIEGKPCHQLFYSSPCSRTS